jgi:hypothetical protein
MLAYNLENDAFLKSRVAGEFQGSLRAARAAAAMRTALYHHAIDPIIELLAAENVRLVLMNGAAITETIYLSFPPRTYSSIMARKSSTIRFDWTISAWRIYMLLRRVCPPGIRLWTSR